MSRSLSSGQTHIIYLYIKKKKKKENKTEREQSYYIVVRSSTKKKKKKNREEIKKRKERCFRIASSCREAWPPSSEPVALSLIKREREKQ